MNANQSNKRSGATIIAALSEVGIPLVEIRQVLPQLLGTSMRAIAREIGMSPPTVSRTMLGHYGHPMVVQGIARELDTPLELLFPEKCKRHKQAA